MNVNKACPPMLICGIIISPMKTHKFLSVILDQALCWTAHIAYAIAKGTAYILQLRQLSTTANSIPIALMRQLYLAVAIPKMLYAADIWFKPIYIDDSNAKSKGSISVAKKLERVQHIAAIRITRAMRSMATDVIKIYANLL
ncbi:hypothetical protein PAXRUDRAFT_116097, partial [Paxillus rubicundulus Ve08.2h10]